MERRHLTCEEVEALARAMLGGDGGGASQTAGGLGDGGVARMARGADGEGASRMARGTGGEGVARTAGGPGGAGGTAGLEFVSRLSALKSHLRGCPACFERFGFDLALLETLRTLPEEPLASISGAVMGRLAARERRFVALRWGVVVSVVALAGATLNALGLGAFRYLSNLMLHGVRSTGEFIAYNKVVTILKDLVETLVLRAFGGALGADLGPYYAQIWVMAIGAAAVVLFVMYLMGLWLRQPRGVKPWHSGRMWHNGMQVW